MTAPFLALKRLFGAVIGLDPMRLRGKIAPIMKIQTRAIAAFIKAPDPAVRVVLVYGPDRGLMQERVEKIGLSVVADLNDPFNVAVLRCAQLGDDPARLNDEAFAISMMGGKRLIRVEDAADSLTPLLKAYLAAPAAEALIVLSAGEMGARSSLRKLCEAAPNAAALPCYLAEAGNIQTMIRQETQAAGFGIDGDACAWLAQQLTGDHQIARMEIAKLTLYMVNTPPGTKISLDNVQACCGQGGEKSLDDLVFSTGGGNPDLAMRSFRQMSDEGMPLIVILRSLQNHFRRLHYVKSLMQSGLSLDAAIAQLNPKIFFKWDAPFRAQVNRWPMAALEGLLMRLAQLEADCKKTGTPDETLTAQAILSLAARR